MCRDANVAIMAHVATASAVTSEPSRPASIPGHGPVSRPNMVSVGTIVWLASELMFFAGLFAMYFTIRSVHPGDWPMHLPMDGKVPPGKR